jgi:MraZ protein
MVVTKGLDGGLFLFPMAEWERLAEKIEALPITNPTARAFSRFLMGDAADCKLDGQGRVLIPRLLLDAAGVDGEVMVIGQGARLEIWAAERLEDVQGKFEKDPEHIASAFADLGI